MVIKESEVVIQKKKILINTFLFHNIAPLKHNDLYQYKEQVCLLYQTSNIIKQFVIMINFL